MEIDAYFLIFGKMIMECLQIYSYVLYFGKFIILVFKAYVNNIIQLFKSLRQTIRRQESWMT